MFAYTKSGIAYQDKNRRSEIGVIKKGNPTSSRALRNCVQEVLAAQSAR
jgi:hypothetical protein